MVQFASNLSPISLSNPLWTLLCSMLVCVCMCVSMFVVKKTIKKSCTSAVCVIGLLCTILCAVTVETSRVDSYPGLSPGLSHSLQILVLQLGCLLPGRDTNHVVPLHVRTNKLPHTVRNRKYSHSFRTHYCAEKNHDLPVDQKTSTFHTSPEVCLTQTNP